MKTIKTVADQDATCAAVLEALADLAVGKPKAALEPFITGACEALPADVRRAMVAARRAPAAPGSHASY